MAGWQDTITPVTDTTPSAGGWKDTIKPAAAAPTTDYNPGKNEGFSPISDDSTDGQAPISDDDLKQGTEKFAEAATLPPPPMFAGSGAGNILKRIAAGTAFGALGGGSKGDTTAQQNQNAEKGAGIGLGASLVAESLPYWLKPMAKLPAWMLGKGEVADEYLNNPTVRAKVNDPAFTFEKNQAAIDNATNQRLTAEGTAANSLADAQDAAKQANQVAGQARQRFGDSLKLQATLPGQIPGMVDQALTKQRGLVSDLARQQGDMLADIPGKFSLAPVEEGLNTELSNTQVSGQSIPGDKDAAAIAALKEMLNPLRSDVRLNDSATGYVGGQPEASAKDLVRLRQIADDKLQDVFASPTGAYTGRAERAGLGARSAINNILDTQLPNSAEYQALRGGLARETDLATRASQAFGGDNQIPKLQSIFSPNSRQDLATLQELDQAHNAGIMSELQPMGDAQNLLKNQDLRARAEAWLPEVEAAQRAGETVDAAKGTVSDLAEQHAPYANITPDNSQSTLRKVLFAGKNNPELRTKEALQALGQDYGNPDLLPDAEALGVKAGLGKAGPQGSRLVQLGKSIGRAAGGVLGEGTAHLGEALGGAAGAGLDYVGGGATKLALDSYLRASQPQTRAAAEMLIPAFTRLMASSSSDKQKYLSALDAAAQRGPEALAVTHAMLQKDPTYAALTSEGT